MHNKTKSTKRITFLLSLAVIFIFDIIFSVKTAKEFPEFTIDPKALYGDDQENLKDFILEENGYLVAESDDPWSYYTFPEAKNIKSVDIITESVKPEHTAASLYFITERGKWLLKRFYMDKGVNSIMANDGEVEKVLSIRFDLLAKKDASVKVERVIINSWYTLTKKYHLMSLFLVIGLIIITLLSDKIKKIRFCDISVGVVISIANSFLLCIFAPLDLYFNNWEEFWFDIYDLLPLVLIMFIVGVLAGCVIAIMLCIINKKLYQLGLILGLLVFICTYIQGNYLVKNLPPLDGTIYDWEDYSSGRIHSVILWVTVITVVAVIIKIVPVKKFYSIAKYVSSGMMLMLLITLCIECVTTYGYYDKLSAAITTKNLMEMSKDKNFIILLLDRLDSKVFNDLMDEHSEYKEIFADFTYYPNTVGGYPLTSRSIPFILTGNWYENDVFFTQYLTDVYKNCQLFSDLKMENYKIGMYETDVPLTDECIFQFDNVFENDIEVTSYWDFAQMILKLTGFKYAPFDLKKICTVYTEEFNIVKDEKNNEDYKLFKWDDKFFYDYIREQAITYEEQNCFKYIHIMGAHVPYRYDKDVNYIENGTYEQSVEASITITKTFLEKLKESGVYDNSVIIVMGDHGLVDHDLPYSGQNPLLMIKGMGEKHELQISKAPISYEDLPVAYNRLLNDLTSDKVFDWKEGDVRERRFLFYRYLKPDHIVEYIQTGEASDLSTMYPTGREFNR